MPTQSNEGITKTAPHKRAGSPRPGSISTAELMGSAKELIILHAEDQYRLRITSNGKLILTK